MMIIGAIRRGLHRSRGLALFAMVVMTLVLGVTATGASASVTHMGTPTVAAAKAAPLGDTCNITSQACTLRDNGARHDYAYGTLSGLGLIGHNTGDGYQWNRISDPWGTITNNQNGLCWAYQSTTAKIISENCINPVPTYQQWSLPFDGSTGNHFIETRYLGSSWHVGCCMTGNYLNPSATSGLYNQWSEL